MKQKPTQTVVIEGTVNHVGTISKIFKGQLIDWDEAQAVKGRDVLTAGRELTTDGRFHLIAVTNLKEFDPQIGGTIKVTVEVFEPQ